MSTQPSIELINISKGFPGVQALSNVSLKIFPGEVVSIIGQNGAGKSTLMNILGGVLKKDDGEIIIKGEKVNFKSPHDAQKKGIAYIHQELTVFNNLTVAENFSINNFDTAKPFWTIRYKKINKKCMDILGQIDDSIRASEKVENLPIGQKQIVEIGRAIGAQASLFIFDEPTSSLTLNEKEKLFNLIDYLKSQGFSIIYITHLFDEITRVASRAYVLRDGLLVGQVETDSKGIKEAIKMMLGQYTDKLYSEDLEVTEKKEFGEEVLKVSINSAANGIRDINFSLKSGEIIGVWGLLGSGRTEMIKAILGLDPLLSGKIEIKKDGEFSRLNKNFTEFFGYVPENRREEGLFLPLSVKKNISIGRIRKITNKIGFVYRKKEEKAIREQIESLDIKVSNYDQPVEFLSGGNQQKVILSRWLMFKSKIFILDDPTRGLDIKAKVDVHEIINKLTKEGVAVIFTSSDIDEILKMSDEIIILLNRKQVKLISKKDATKENLMSYAMGVT